MDYDSSWNPYLQKPAIDGKVVFERELNLIKNQEVRRFAEYCIDRLPQYFYNIPASSTGKYHPEYSLGQGGLVRHVKAAVKIAEDLMSLRQNKDMRETPNAEYQIWDIVIVALLLHDGFKSGFVQERYTRFDHPTLMAGKIYEWSKDCEYISENFVKHVASAVASHMGEWNTNPYTDKVLPLPETEIQKFVHMCDYLASRKYLEVNFNKMES